MGTEQVPSQLGSIEQSARKEAMRISGHGADSAGKCACKSGNKSWIRALAVTSLAAGAALAARGNRRQGLIATAAGVMILLLEHPDDVGAIWGAIPQFIQTSRRLLDRTEGIVQDVTDQAETVRDFLNRATAQRS